MITYVIVHYDSTGTPVDILACNLRRAHKARRHADRLIDSVPAGHSIRVERTDEFDGTLRAKLEARRLRRMREAEKLQRAKRAAAQNDADAHRRLIAARQRNEIAESEFRAQMIARRLRAAESVTRELKLKTGLTALVSGPKGVL